MSSGGLRPGEEITSVIDISAAALDECSNQVSGVELVTFPGSPAISGQVIQTLIAGGISGTLYKITIKFSTDSSPICEEDFLLYVHDV
jgi:hypothetical protein